MVSYPPNSQELTKPFSEDTARIIDLQVRNMVDSAYNRTLELVREKKDLVDALAKELLLKEVLQTTSLLPLQVDSLTKF